MSFPSTRTDQSIVNTTRAAMPNRAVFFASLATLYTAAIIAATLTLHPYFSQTWDVQTFIQAGAQFSDGGNPFDLYAESRAAQTWPYAYPPLHAFVTALALALGNLFRFLPDYVWARVPTIIADLALAYLLHTIVRRKSSDEQIARAAAMVWLFNPITFYNTAVQGHFESEWLVLVLLAHVWLDEGRSIILPTMALAIAVLFKQVAIVFVIPVWVALTIRIFTDRRPPTAAGIAVSRQRSVVDLVSSLAVFASIISLICLPFLLYSNDFLFMNLTYVENVPVQTQSWIVAVLGLTRDAPNAMTSDFFLLRYQTIVTIIAAMAISFIGARRGWNMYLIASLIALAFFLTSKKVMGYYYVMLLPFLLAELLPRKRFELVTIALVATTYISLSPYYAAWTNHAHWWTYAGLGILNSAFFVWLGKKLTEDERQKTEGKQSVVGLPSSVGLALFAGAFFASLWQPLIGENGSPIRAPIVAAGIELNAVIAFGALIVGIGGTVIGLRYFFRRGQARNRGHNFAWSAPFIFAPLFFSVYTLTKESTAIFEIALKGLGV